jgi:hypothetical protein
MGDNDAQRKGERLTRPDIRKTDDNRQQTRHCALGHDLTIVEEWVETDCAFTHVYKSLEN